MTKAIAAGWIVWQDASVYGTGTTHQAALNDAREWAEDWDGSWEVLEDGREQSGVMYVAPATQALLDAVRGGNPSVAHGWAGATDIRDVR